MSTPTNSSSSGDPSSHSSQSQTQSQSTLDTVSTQDVVDGMSDGEQANVPQPWGRLFPIGTGFKVVELIDDEYSFGRGNVNTYQFDIEDFKQNPHYHALSTKHYKLYREKNSNGSFNTFITDLSSNGTFINQEKIGRDKTHVLNNNDEISLSVGKNKAYIYQELGKAAEEQQNLPENFKAKYTLSKEIGRGACGEVRLCFTKGQCERFAVKIISKKQFSVRPTSAASTKDEVEILKSLDHPTAIHIEDVFETPETLYIVLELVEGGELFDRVKKEGQMKEPSVKLLFYQMLIGVKYLHDKGITHRDLKPENVLLASDKTDTLIKITDFGLSKMVGEQSLMKTLCGTPTYLAPEVLKPNDNVGGYSNAVDCWSLGVILFVCLGGYPPFSENITPLTLTQQVCLGKFTFHKRYWDSVSAEAKDLVTKLLTVDPSRRLSVEQALEHSWMKDEEVILKAKAIMYPTEDDMRPPSHTPAKRRKIE